MTEVYTHNRSELLILSPTQKHSISVSWTKVYFAVL